MNIPPVFRVRVQYSKQEALRYTGSLDMHHIWERSFRRARLPLAYSQGFHPQPRINQALPLPLGMTSKNDLVEFWLEREMELLEVTQALIRAIPPGLEIHSAQIIDLRTQPLPVLVESAQYWATLLDACDIEQLENGISSLLAQPHILREKRGKNYDLRPLIEQITLHHDSEEPQLFMQLAAREGATGRPEEVLAALGLDPLAARIERTGLILKS